MAKEYEVSKDSEWITVLEGEAMVATFPANTSGEEAFSAFVTGVSEQKGSVWDRSTAQYLVGTMGQLVEGRPG